VHRAGLGDGVRPDGLDRLRQALEAVAAGDQRVADAAVGAASLSTCSQNFALGRLDSDRDHVLDPVGVDSDQMCAALLVTCSPSRTFTTNAPTEILRAAPGPPRRVPPAGRFPVHAIPTATSRVLASDRRLAPSPRPLDRTATTTHIKSARGVPTGSNAAKLGGLAVGQAVRGWSVAVFGAAGVGRGRSSCRSRDCLDHPGSYRSSAYV
jgi:hypothetical protein